MINITIDTITPINYIEFSSQLNLIDEALSDGDLSTAIKLKDMLDDEISHRYNVKKPLAYNYSITDNLNLAYVYEIDSNIPVQAKMYLFDEGEVYDLEYTIDTQGTAQETFHTFEEVVKLKQLDNEADYINTERYK